MAEVSKALYYGMENSTTADPPCTNPHEFSDEIWKAWNIAGGEERIKYIEHAEMLIDRGYIALTEGRDLMDVAMSVFAAKLADNKKKSIDNPVEVNLQLP